MSKPGVDEDLKQRFKDAGLWWGRGSFTQHQVALRDVLVRPIRARQICLARFVPLLEQVEAGTASSEEALDGFFEAGVKQFAADVASKEETLREKPKGEDRTSGATRRAEKAAKEYAALTDSAMPKKKKRKYKKRKKRKAVVAETPRAQCAPTAEVAGPDAGGDDSGRGPAPRGGGPPGVALPPQLPDGAEAGPPVGCTRDDIRWVYDHMGDKPMHVDVGSAPSRGAVAMHRYFQGSAISTFYEKMVPKILPKEAEADPGEEALVRGDHILTLIEDVRKQKQAAEDAQNRSA